MVAGAGPLTEPSMATPGASKSAAAAPATANREENAQADASPLLSAGEATSCRAHWGKAQTSFVGEPRHAVEQADGRVAEMMQGLARVFADECTRLEQQWCQGDDVSTEDRRVRLRRYRSFFDRLLSA
jgi:hypothetical protein